MTLSRNVKWHYYHQQLPGALDVKELAYSPAIPLLGTFTEDPRTGAETA